jgi:hypothetical protein
VAPETGQTVSVIAIDSTAATLPFGSAGTAALWNPAAGTGRALSIVPSSNLDAGPWTIIGRDMYGYKITETILSSQVTATQKTYKYVSSIIAATTITSTGVSIGLTDTYGFPMAVAYSGANVSVGMSSGAGGGAIVNTIVLSTVNSLFASTAATQSSTTPDVRGTFTSSIASNGANRLQMIVTPGATAFATVGTTTIGPIFGATQFSSV